MSNATFLVGDVRARMAEMPDASFDLIMCSPPFLALRSYLPPGHPDKDLEIGSEATPAEFLDTMLALTAGWGRLLAPHGSVAIELGDTYSGSGGAGGDYGDGGLREGQGKFEGSGRRNRPADVAAGILAPTKRPGPEGRDRMPGWPLDKSLTMIPQLYATALAYGINPLTGAESPAGRWRVRNLVAWVRPNPPVGALGDKFRPATSYVTVACRARDRWFDLDAVRVEPKPHSVKYGDAETRARHSNAGYVVEGRGDGGRVTGSLNPAGAPPLDWWEIVPGGYSGAHYATWPMELCKRLIDSMCPRQVCTTCGQPRRRIVGEATYVGSNGREVAHNEWGSGIAEGKAAHSHKPDGGVTKVAPTLGWSDCGHGTWRPGRILDPFVGSGTTLAVATGMGRDATGIDLDARNADLARERVGMFLDIDDPEEIPA